MLTGSPASFFNAFSCYVEATSNVWLDSAMRYFVECLKKYAVFTGRASRPEFWYFYLFCLLIVMVIGFISGIVGTVLGYQENVLMIPPDIFILAIGLPSWAVVVRRCHDIGLNPWWSLLTLIPLGGLLVLIGIGVQPGQPGTNQHGPNPSEVEKASSVPTATT